jgi:hypothetical protein
MSHVDWPVTNRRHWLRRVGATAHWLCVGLLWMSCRPSAPGSSQAPLATKQRAAAPPEVGRARADSVHVDAPGRTEPVNQRMDVNEALRYDPSDPLGNLEAADALDRGAPSAAPRKVVVPARGCAIAEGPRRVWSKPAVASIAAFGDGFVLAGYTRSQEREQVFVVHVSNKGKLEPVATLPLDQALSAERAVAPGLAADSSQGVTVAYTDGKGALFSQSLRVGAAHGGGAALTVAPSVDIRFAPAVAYGKRGALIAYTLGSTPMRVMLVRLDPKAELLSSHDITPPAMGAAAPAFVSGATPPWLITADPRNGLSPIARIPLDAEGKPGPAAVAAPVGMMSQPPQLAAAEASFGAYALYTGLGTAATSAVGLVRIAPKAASPEPFVKGIAYGALHVSALGAKNALLLAADAPIAPGKQPQHEIQVALVDANGQGPLLRVASPSGDATHAALARTEQAGVGLAFSARDGVYLTKLRCAGF